MSKISDLHAALKSRLLALFPIVDGFVQLTNPYNVAANTITALEKGWGLAIGPGLNTNRQLSCQLSIGRSMIVVLTRQFFANELDVDAKESGELLLMEDQFKVINDFESEPTINKTVAKSNFISDEGIKRVFETKDQYMKLESVFEMEYLENLT